MHLPELNTKTLVIPKHQTNIKTGLRFSASAHLPLSLLWRHEELDSNFVGPFNNRDIPERRLLQVQTCQTYSEGRPQVLRAARRPQSVHRPYAPTQRLFLLWNVSNCPPSAIRHQSTTAKGKGWNAHFRELDELLGEEGHADRDDCLGETDRFARKCELIVDPDGRCWPRTREPINRDPREHCETNSVRLGYGNR